MRNFVSCLAIMCVAACSTLGLTTPKSFDEQLGNAYGVHTAVVVATTNALQSGVITSTEATLIQKQATNSRSLLDAAKAAEQAANMTTANNDLSLALISLNALQSYLNSQQKGK